MSYYPYQPRAVYYVTMNPPFEVPNSTNTTSKFCLACAEGMYCSVAASMVHMVRRYPEYQPQLLPPQRYLGWRMPLNENVSGIFSSGITSDRSGSKESTLSSENIMEHRDIQKFLSSSRFIPEHSDEIFMKRESHQRHQVEVPDQVPNKVTLTLDENGNRKRYSRFRIKNHVCDFCNKSFTLKQNVQTHMSLYHMSVDSEVKLPAQGKKTRASKKR